MREEKQWLKTSSKICRFVIIFNIGTYKLINEEIAPQPAKP
jgi:hypothetical protein